MERRVYLFLKSWDYRIPHERRKPVSPPKRSDHTGRPGLLCLSPGRRSITWLADISLSSAAKRLQIGFKTDMDFAERRRKSLAAVKLQHCKPDLPVFLYPAKAR